MAAAAGIQLHLLISDESAALLVSSSLCTARVLYMITGALPELEAPSVVSHFAGRGSRTGDRSGCLLRYVPCRTKYMSRFRQMPPGGLLLLEAPRDQQDLHWVMAVPTVFFSQGGSHKSVFLNFDPIASPIHAEDFAGVAAAGIAACTLQGMSAHHATHNVTQKSTQCSLTGCCFPPNCPVAVNVHAGYLFDLIYDSLQHLFNF